MMNVGARSGNGPSCKHLCAVTFAVGAFRRFWFFAAGILRGALAVFISHHRCLYYESVLALIFSAKCQMVT